MAGSCCGGTSKSVRAEVVIAPVLKTTEAVTEKQAAKSECCNDRSSATSEKCSCGC